MSRSPVSGTVALRRVLILAFALAGAVIALAATSATRADAYGPHTVRQLEMIQGSTWTVHDDETWGGDEEKTWEFTSNQFWNPFFDETLKTYTNSTYRCAGDEVRADTKLTAYIDTDLRIYASITTKLYEGASCYSNDLDGQKTVSFSMAPGQTKWIDVYAPNSDEGGDWSMQHIGFKYTTTTKYY